MRSKKILTISAGFLGLLSASPAAAQEFYIGQILALATSFCPKGTLEANGQMIPKTGNAVLFSVLGTRYGPSDFGGFSLPDMRGRMLLMHGNYGDSRSHEVGERGGAEKIPLTLQQMPIHSHRAIARGVDGAGPDSNNPAGGALGDFEDTTIIYNNTTVPNSKMAAGTVAVGSAGAGQPFDIRSPYLTIRYCIVTQGIMPPHN